MGQYGFLLPNGLVERAGSCFVEKALRPARAEAIDQRYTLELEVRASTSTAGR
jgi:hypothetical protein